MVTVMALFSVATSLLIFVPTVQSQCESFTPCGTVTDCTNQPAESYTCDESLLGGASCVEYTDLCSVCLRCCALSPTNPDSAFLVGQCAAGTCATPAPVAAGTPTTPPTPAPTHVCDAFDCAAGCTGQAAADYNCVASLGSTQCTNYADQCSACCFAEQTGSGAFPTAVVYDSLCSAGNCPTSSPTGSPSKAPSKSPTASPSNDPSATPSATPSKAPSESPSEDPTQSPSTMPPSSSPTSQPSRSPLVSGQTHSPSPSPTRSPSDSPSKSPSDMPTTTPSETPSASPSKTPSGSPSMAPSESPSASPSQDPTADTEAPSEAPSGSPSNDPSMAPSKAPVAATPSPEEGNASSGDMLSARISATLLVTMYVVWMF